MSFAVVRQEASQAQIYLDSILEKILQFRTGNDFNVRVSEVLLFCMRRNRIGIFMVNGATGESFTNEHILKVSVQLARALTAKDVSGKTIMMMLRNHENMAAVYYGSLFAGTIPFMIDPNCTMYELNYFKALICPHIIFCEKSREDDVRKTVNDTNGVKPDIIVADYNLQLFVAGYSDNIDDFRIADVDYELPVMMLPTSGSTGLPKAAMLSHKGLVAQLPTFWTYHTQFPRSTKMAMLISTAQWMTHTDLMTSCPVYEITLLMTPTPTVNCILSMIQKHMPTWALLGPAFVNSLASAVSSQELISFETILTTGAQLSPDTMKSLKAKLSLDVHLCNGYGMTEAHGFITIPDPSLPMELNGKIINIFDYKLLDETGKEVANGETGELVLHSASCILQGYYKNKDAYQECITEDGWLKTGDIFYQNNDGVMYFVERKNFWFKYMNYHISPEEVEAVIGNVSGVEECVVCETSNGAAAGIVRRPGYNVTENDVNNIVNSTLSDYKHLRGGIVFVSSLPHTHSGKLHRADCRRLINKLLGYKE